jgi:hypothetical protein
MLQWLEDFAALALLVVEGSTVVIDLVDTTSLLILFVGAFGRRAPGRLAAGWLFFILGIGVGFAVRFTWHFSTFSFLYHLGSM